MKNKIFSILLGVIGVILILACLYFTISYLSYIGKVLIDFFSANNVQAISDCGVFIPDEFTEIRNQIPSTILPAVYIGMPLSLILLSVLMFFSGYFFGKHKVEHDLDAHIRREEEIEEEVQKRVGGKKPEKKKGKEKKAKAKKGKEEEEEEEEE